MRQDAGCKPIVRRAAGAAVVLTMLGSGAGMTAAWANEGMWMPQQLPQIANELRSAGLALDPAQLTRLTEFPMGAMVSLGGCSASFVSPRGLVVTNHHCAYGSIQYNSTAEKNLLRDGFLARQVHEEVPASPGSRVYVTVDVQDVIDRILDAKTVKLTGGKRTDAIEANQKALIAGCERDGGHRCSVSSFYGGVQFQLIKSLEIRDVRLVYAPPEGVGKFGGDTDNWMWPRHTGDFSFYRAYVGLDGKPADFSPDNVPYQPRHHLKLAPQGVSEGDFVMIAGYPGRTYRHRLPSEVEFTFGWRYPASIKAASEELAIIERETRGREGAALAYASSVASINNGYKNKQGMLASFQNADFLADKQREASLMKAWVQADPARASKYSADITAVEGLLAERNATTKREFLLNYVSPRLLEAASALYELAQQKAKADDAQRKPGFQQRDWPEIRQSLLAIDKRYDQQVDKALAAEFLAQYLAQPKGELNVALLQALSLKPGMSTADIASQLDRLYAGSQLATQASRLAWMDKDVTAFKSSGDTFIKVAVALYEDDNKREKRDRELAGKIQRAYTGYMKALLAYRQSRGEAVYPDANSTLRLTFGHVTPRTPGSADGTAWTAFTTVAGIVAKHTGAGEFDAPKKEIEAIKAGRFERYTNASLRTVPVNFLATLDITGGNSGSAVLNSRAELVGLAFDGTLDSVISDWNFNPAMTRTIAVDVRYMLWYMDVVDNAHELLTEMGVPATSGS